MDKPAESIRAVDAAVIDRIFLALHGYFGKPFHERFMLGESVNGKDIGLENAKRIWLAELQSFTVFEVFGALRKVRDSGATFPPSLPEFVAACKASRRPVAQTGPRLALPAPGSIRRRLTEQRQGLDMRPTGGLATLMAITARAVAQAGGDEVTTLRRLESEIMRPQP